MSGRPRMMYRCPHCKGRATVRTSRDVTPLLRELTYQCPGPECSHSFLVHAEVVRTLSPSGTPDPAVHLPISEKTRQAIAAHSTMAEAGGAPGVRLLVTEKARSTVADYSSFDA